MCRSLSIRRELPPGSGVRRAAATAEFSYSARSAATVAVVLTAAMLGCGSGDRTKSSNEASAAPPATSNTLPNPFSRRIPAPSLEGGLEWVNTDKPLSLADLRGKFVLLDFWTYCCINCMHVLPEVKKLEQAYPQELVVIGVHSAKFEGEQETQNIREAVMRYEIEHPVVNDEDMKIWNRYGVRSWPTLVLIDPVGDVVWLGRGEQTFDDLRAPLELGLPYYRQRGLLATSPSPTVLESRQQPDTPLKFPGKVLADPDAGRLFIADSNHNRIVVADLAGKLLLTIGTGAIGRADGPVEQSSFHHPQGMALVGNVLYVADTENHLLRKVDLTTRQVSTVAGTGEKGSALAAANRRVKPQETPLNSPWALSAHDGQLYIAMAGLHQIWRMSLDETDIGPHAGNGREDIVDGPLLPRARYTLGYASFAQPSGLASDGQRLFVADSEGSVIRAVPFDPNGAVATLVGPTGNLFDFGDTDGTGRDVRLQHPLGVVYHDGRLYVADTYNNKIKVIDVSQRACRTLAGSGRPGHDDAQQGVQATFNEPAGLAAVDDKLYVADTNSHAVRVVELGDGYRVSTMVIDGLVPPPSENRSPDQRGASPAAK